MAHIGNALSPVGFGAGEPDLQPIYDTCKKIGAYSSSTVVINLVIVVVSNYFSRSFISPFTAGLMGFMTAISYPLAKKAVEQLPVHQQKLPGHEAKEKGLVVTSVIVSSFVFSQFLGEVSPLPSVALSVFDVAWLYYLVDSQKNYLWGS